MPQENDKILHNFTKSDGNNFYSQFLNKKIDFTTIFEFYLWQGIWESFPGIVAL